MPINIDLLSLNNSIIVASPLDLLLIIIQYIVTSMYCDYELHV